jgi:hypothetical protein
MTKKLRPLWLAGAALALISSFSLFAWEKPIRVDSGDGNRYMRPSVKFGPSGKVFMVYEYGNETAGGRDDIYLRTYDGEKLSPIINVTQGNAYSRRPYYPDIAVSKNEELHVVWLEYVRGSQSLAQYLMYRYFNGSSWGPIEQLHVFTRSAWCEEPTVAVDSNNNIFVSVFNETIGRCAVATKYFGKKATVDFPNVPGRSKYASVAADDNFVHLAWQYLTDSYTIMYTKKKNQEGSTWQAPLDFKISLAQKPKIKLNNDGNPSVAFAKKLTESSRNFRLRPWDEKLGLANRNNVIMLTTEEYRTYHYFSFSIQNNAMFAAWQIGSHSTGANGGVFYSQKGVDANKWVIQQTLPEALNPVIVSSDQTWDGKIAGILYASANTAIYLHLSDKLVTNDLPKAVISADREEIFWGETINFNGSSSSDNDGSIVKYEWRVIPANAVFEGVSGSYTFTGAYGNVKVRLTVTDDKNGRGVAEKTIRVNALYTAPATWSWQKINTLLYDREGNVVTWQPNPKNDALGLNIVAYRVFRREADGGSAQVMAPADARGTLAETGAGNADTPLKAGAAQGVGGDWLLLGEMTAEKRAYADVSAEKGKTYEYAVAAVDDQGMQSPYDNF